MRHPFRYSALPLLLAALPAFAQSTATIAGTVKDPTGAVLPGAVVVVQNTGTGTQRTVKSDSAGDFVVPSLQPGDYNITVTAAGFAPYTVQHFVLQVDQTETLSPSLAPAGVGATVQVEGGAPVIQAQTITVGEVISPRTVQELPLNGRHFLDLTVLTPGGVIAPVTGSLTAASRGLGANSFDTAGDREDTVNFQINGINLNDLVQNQITFQPSIDTTSEFKINNQTFSAEYGRSSGSVVNVNTRSGTNQFHGDAFEYLRNDSLDARNYFNPDSQLKAEFHRSNFGASVGGPILRNHTFFYASYEGLRQHQGLPTQSGVLTAAQRAAVTNPQALALLPFIPIANTELNGSTVPNGYVSVAAGPVQTDQGTLDLEQVIGNADTLHGFYALQEDTRTEPILQGDTIPGFGDHRHAKRQILTVNEVHVFSPNLVNEARLGFNRIYIDFANASNTNPSSLGIDTGNTGNTGLPFFELSAIGLNFGGPATFPQGRTDTLAVLSDALTATKGKHSIKMGGEFRRFINANFTGDPGTVVFATLADFEAGTASAFSITPITYTSRIYENALDAFVQDSFKVTPQLLLEYGLRFEWNASPTAGNNKMTVFEPGSAELVQVGTNGLGRSPFAQNYNFEPRVGFSYDLFGTGKSVVRAAYGYMVDQPETNIASTLSSNPPFSATVSYSNAAAPIPLSSLYTAAAAAGISITSVQPRFRNQYIEDFNLNLQQELAGGIAVSIGYYGSVGHHLRQYLNLNQPNTANVRPYQTLSTASPIDPGKSIAGVNLLESANVGQSNYNAMWATVQKNFHNGLEFEANYNLSKSMDLGSLYTTYLQDSTRPYLNYARSDFDTRNRVAGRAVYNLPFKGNRFVKGFQIIGVVQAQSGNPLNVVTSTTPTGLSGVAHPNLVGPVRYTRARTSATAVQWFSNSVCTYPAVTPGCTFQIYPSNVYGANGLGNLSRNALTGPSFSDLDMSLAKDTKIRGNLTFNLRIDAFDVPNHPNFGNPGLTATATSTSFGTITSTRFATGDQGSSRQLQIAGKFVF